MKPKRILSAALVLALLLTLLGAGCSSGSSTATPSPAPEEIEPTPVPVRAGSLVLGALAEEPRNSIIREIIVKYQVDNPDTSVTLREFDSREEIVSALRAGEIDIADLSDKEQPELVREGLLADFYERLSGWDEWMALDAAGRLVLDSMGKERAYLFPADLRQDLLYIRKDRIDAYNEDKAPGDILYYRTWASLILDAQALGEEGKLAFAGADGLARLFDNVMWSSTGRGAIVHSGAAYIGAGPASIFSKEKAWEGAIQFSELVDELIVPESFTWSREQAIEAFAQGKVSFLLADRDAAQEIAQAGLDPELWEGTDYPRGLAGTGILRPESLRGWGISAKSQAQEPAFWFLCFLSNADNNTHLAKLTDSVPVHTQANSLEPSILEGKAGMEYSMVKRTDVYAFVEPPWMYRAQEEFAASFEEEQLRRFLAGELDIEGLMITLDGYWTDALMDEGRIWD